MSAPSGDQKQIRSRTEPAPRGRERFRWYGPGLLWMVASVGSGSVLFTPRVGSRYGYDLLWMVFLIAFLIWAIIREIGRYTVVSGKTILDGFREVPGPRGWAVWLIFLPGLVSGFVVVAGIAALAGSALMIAFPGDQLFYAPALILLSMILVVTGRYKKVEQVTSVMALILVLSVIGTAIVTFPGFGTLAPGLVPRLSEDFDTYFVLPWIGFLLAGAAGIMWFSYWVGARGFGGKVTGEGAEEGRVQADAEKRKELHAWLKTMGITAGIGVVGGTLVIASFLILGAELLGPQGIVPEGIRVAEDLTQLLSQVWGALGFWLLITGIVIALGGTIIANQDGWGRMYADATMMLLPQKYRENRADDRAGWLHKLASNRIWLRNAYVIVVLTAIPIIIFLLVRDPVPILSVGGIITAAHTPVVVFLTLYLNKKRLPKEFQPGRFWSWVIILSGFFYGFFALFYFYDLLTPGGNG